MFESELYKKDPLGLRLLDRTGRLHFAACDCKHREASFAVIMGLGEGVVMWWVGIGRNGVYVVQGNGRRGVRRGWRG